MTSLVEKKPLNQREFSFYMFFAVLILFLIFIAALSIFYLLPRPNVTLTHIPIGETTDFPATDRPYLVRAEETSLFIVRTETGWLAFNHRTPYEMSVGRCLFVWTEANGRFEDPCSGSKFSLTGQLIERPAAQNLDQYPITEISGELFVDLTTLIPGEPAEPIQ
ncbi:MAG: hypothetical protein GWN67_22295 [Phycisphaerae bacterium]|nr:hypothetical protein [Phycisphaerae bacterium]